MEVRRCIHNRTEKQVCRKCNEMDHNQLQCMLTTEQYHDRISTMAFDLLLLKLEIEEKDKEIRQLMRDKIELACELAQVTS